MAEGYRASVDRIAALAGVAKQTLYNHFGSKEELYTEVGAHLADQAAVELNAAATEDLRETLIRFGLDIRNRALSDHGIALFRAFNTEGARFPEMSRAIHVNAFQRLRARIAEVLAIAGSRGQLSIDVPEFAAAMLLGMLVDADRLARLTGDPRLPTKQEEQRVHKIVDCYLRAFQPQAVTGA